MGARALKFYTAFLQRGNSRIRVQGGSPKEEVRLRVSHPLLSFSIYPTSEAGHFPGAWKGGRLKVAFTPQWMVKRKRRTKKETAPGVVEEKVCVNKRET